MKVAFIDRDGVINEEIGYLHRIKDFQYTKNCIEGLKFLIVSGFALIIVTNQAGIAKGFYTVNDYKNLMDWMVSDLDKHDINFKDILYCPHHPDGVIEKYAIDCSHRKPSPGMFLKARDIHNIDMKNSIVIGDKITDLQAGMKAGVGKAFLVESGHHITKNDYKNYDIYKNLYEVSKSF